MKTARAPSKINARIMSRYSSCPWIGQSQTDLLPGPGRPCLDAGRPVSAAGLVAVAVIDVQPIDR